MTLTILLSAGAQYFTDFLLQISLAKDILLLTFLVRTYLHIALSIIQSRKHRSILATNRYHVWVLLYRNCHWQLHQLVSGSSSASEGHQSPSTVSTYHQRQCVIIGNVRAVIGNWRWFVWSKTDRKNRQHYGVNQRSRRSKLVSQPLGFLLFIRLERWIFPARWWKHAYWCDVLRKRREIRKPKLQDQRENGHHQPQTIYIYGSLA